MQKLLILLAFVTGCVTLPKKEIPKAVAVTPQTVQIIGLLTAETIDQTVQELKKAPEGVTVYIHSKGGNLQAFKPLIYALKEKRATCIATFAGGPTLSLFQACHVRVVAEKSIIGRPNYDQIKLNVPPQIKEIIEELEELESDGTNKKPEEIKKLVDNTGHITLDAQQAVNQGFADGIAKLGCSKESEVATVSRTFGDKNPDELPVTLVMTQCPVSRILVEFQPAQLLSLPNGRIALKMLIELIGVPISDVQIEVEQATTPI